MRFISIIFVFCSLIPCFGQDVITSKIWDHRYGGSNVDILWGLTPAKGGGYVLAGQTQSDSSGDKTQASRGYIDYWVVKVNDAGIKQWDYRFGGSSNNGASDVLRGIHPTADSGYILVGASNTGNASATTFDFYVDSVSAGNGTADTAGNIATIQNTATPFTLGAFLNSGAPSLTLDSLLDEVRVWNTVRTATQIANNYNIELVGNETGLVAYYPFEALTVVSSGGVSLPVAATSILFGL